jgi:hypothetical protein
MKILAKLTVISVFTLAGCGGRSGISECGLADHCNADPGPIPGVVLVGISPARITALAGTAVTFNAEAGGLTNPTYAWCRRPGAGGHCIPIASAVGPTFTIASVGLAEDGDRFEVTASGPEGTGSAGARIAVSSMPGVLYAEGDFPESEWVVSTTVAPAQDGPVFTAERSDEGGHPGAFRSATYDFPSRQPGTVRIFHARRSAMYSPASQGVIHVIDFAEDCIVTSVNTVPELVPLLEQQGRRFMASGVSEGVCRDWSTRRHSSLSRDAFVLVDGPACGANESCPDFSPTGAPIHLGLVAVGRLGHTIPSTVAVTGPSSVKFDNWTATVWGK